VELLEISLWHDKNDLYNSHGFRDKEYSYKKPNNIFRILVLGDSQTSGQGIENLNDTWHKKLEVLMNKNFKQPKFEIISLAGQGWNTDTQLYELFKKGFKYNPNLILIGFNHNDVPVPYSSNCEYRDIKFFPHVKPIGQLREFSKVYQLAEFRLNRLLEKLEQKPEYADCINRRFESRGWDMEKVYLDTILMAAQIKNIHIMLTTLPLLSKLGDNYPLKKAHLKIKNYCSDREIICSDLYDEGFKGLNPTPLKVSKTDWHFNEDGSEIIAQTLFKKLKALKTYDHLSKFSSAFDLKDLLNQKTLITKLDKKFSDFKRQSPNFRINFKNEQLFVKTQSKRLEYTHIISNTLNHKIIKVILDPNGNFKESKITLQKNSDPKVYFYNNKRQNKRHYLIRRIKTKQGDILNENKKIFLGDYVATRFISKIQLFPNMDFMDPKNLEIAFSENTRPKNQLSSQEIFNAISKFVKLNPDLFFDFLNKGYLVKRNFNQLSKLEQTIMYKEMEWTKYLITLYKLRHISYINTLISDILDNNPVPVLLRSIERFYFLNQRFKDLNNLYQSNSTLPRRFKLPTSQQIV
jgi:lysophospholipase L1-like esterase